MVGSAFLFAGMGAMVKLASGALPNTVVVFFRNAVALAFLLPWAASRGTTLRTRHLREHLVRSLAGLASMYLFFYAIAHMRLAEAMLLNYSLPLFMPFVEQAWLGEPTPRRIWWALAIGFLGLIVILKPGFALFNPIALCALGSALLAAVAQVGVRRLTQTEPATRIVLYFTLLSTLVSALPLVGSWRAPEPALWWVLVAMGGFAIVGQLLLTRAYGEAPAAQVGPFIYTSVVFAGIFDAWLWRSWPDRLFVAGGVLVCLAGILTLRGRRSPPLATA
jgi:drug/metabolite transporter (DMT)-like permease